MRIALFLTGALLMLASGCTVVSYNRAFPKLTWYWSADAKAQRADKAAEKAFERTNTPPQTP